MLHRFFFSTTAILLFCLIACVPAFGTPKPVFKAGTGIADITPSLRDRPNRGNGYTVPADVVHDPLHARSLALHDGKECIVLLVVDVCGVSRALTDNIKAIVHAKTGVPVDRIMVSATHTHSAPNPPAKARKGELHFTPENMASAAVAAYENLTPAKIGWAVGNDPNNVFVRRFLMQDDSVPHTNPGMGVKDRVRTNPGAGKSNILSPAGPVDSLIPVISVVSTKDEPIAVFANYSAHHTQRGLKNNEISAGRFGVFCEEMKKRIAEKVGKDKMSDKFVAIMAQGTSGDAVCGDALGTKKRKDYVQIGRENAEAAMVVWPNIEYHDWVPLRMTERILRLKSYKPAPEDIQAAKDLLADETVKKSRTQTNSLKSIAAAEKWEDTLDVLLQAMRIGDFGITTLPGEFFGITGIRLKAKSPFQPTMNIGMANDSLSYVPPPEQFKLGGYEVWRSSGRRSGVDAEPKIIQTLLEMLDELK